MANSAINSGSPQGKTRRAWRGRLLWICPVLGLIAGGAVLWLFGTSLWTAVAFLFLIGCPLAVVWVLMIARQENRKPRKRP